MSLLKIHNRETSNIILSIFLGFVFGLIANYFNSPDDNIVTPVAFGIFFTLLFNSFLLNLTQSKEITKLKSSFDEINESQSTQNLNNTALLERLKSTHKRYNKVHLHLHSRNTGKYVRQLGINIFENYIKKFQMTENGFKINGEVWALECYIKLWEILSEEQKTRKREGKQPIIARVTHSNDIRIWLPEFEPQSQQLYAHQKIFIENGGVIVRIIIGDEDKPTEPYKKAMEQMKNIGIEVLYFSVKNVGEEEFDYLFLYDEDIVLKWHSGQKGKRLTGCSIEELTDKENDISRKWNALFHHADVLERPIKSIPDGRHLKNTYII